MDRTRKIFSAIVFFTLAVIVVYVWIFLPESGDAAETMTAPTPLPPGLTLVTVASSNTKDTWLDQAVAQFNAEGHKNAGGNTIWVEANHVTSGPSMEAILSGTLQPVVWSPGDGSWVEQLNADWQQENNKPINSQSCKATVYAPVGFAIWRPMAEALGWPDEPVGWDTIIDLAADPQGWASYGHPEWGQFRFGHTHPAYSNTGLLSLTSFVYGALGTQEQLTAAQVYEAEEAMRALEQITAKYGRNSRPLLDLMASEGPAYLHAAAVPEANVVRYNIEHDDELRFPLVFIIPAGGTIWADHPYCILDNAGWVTPEQAEAAAIFGAYLLAPQQQEAAIDHYLRPVDASIPLHAPLDLEHGTDPRLSPKVVPPLLSPNAEVSASVVDLFYLTKRKATILIVLDTSGSMKGDKLKSATEATAAFLSRLQPGDEVALMTFSNQVATLSGAEPISAGIEALREQVLGLFASGDTALYAAVCQASQMAADLKARDQANGESRIYGIVVLSDGEDTVNKPTQNQMFTNCLPDNAEVDGFKVFPIAFGEDAAMNLLQRIANVTGGHFFEADPASIDDVYVSISAEQ